VGATAGWRPSAKGVLDQRPRRTAIHRPSGAPCATLLRVRMLPALVMIFCLVTACGGSDDEPTAAPRGQETVTVTASPESDASPTYEVEIKQLPQRPPPVDLSSYDVPGFTTPSGNIGCQFDDYQGAHVRCDRLEMTSVPGGKPADCVFDWGHSVELSVGDRGALACTSDSVMGQQGETDGTQALPYGDSVRYRGIVCTSTKQGLRCSTRGGHGFLLSRATIRVR
jgi:hypothetical protein